LDKIVYKDGDRTVAIKGKILSEDEHFIVLEREDRIVSIGKDNIIAAERLK